MIVQLTEWNPPRRHHSGVNLIAAVKLDKKLELVSTSVASLADAIVVGVIMALLVRHIGPRLSRHESCIPVWQRCLRGNVVVFNATLHDLHLVEE